MLLQFIKWAMAKHNCKPLILLLNGGDLQAEFKSLGPTWNLASHYTSATISEKIIGRFSLVKKKERYAVRILKEIKNCGPKVCYANTVASAAILPSIKDIIGIKVLLHVHEMAFSANTFYHEYLSKDYFGIPSKFIAVSAEVKFFLTGGLNIPDKKVVVIPPFIASQYFNIIPKEKRVGLLVFTVGLSGFGGWQKGIDLLPILIKEVSKIKPADAEIKFLWVGNMPGVKKTKLFYLLDLIGVGKDLKVIDHTEDLAFFYGQMDAFVLLSVEDSYPLVCMESACFQLPILCFDKAGGAADFVSGDCGISVPFLDIPEMARSIVNLVSDPGLAKRLGTNAANKALNYSVENFGPSMWNELMPLFKTQ